MANIKDRIFSVKLRRALFRYFVYGSLFIAGEVMFYTIVKVGRTLPGWINWLFHFDWLVDPRLDLGQVWNVPIKTLYGQASMWMFFVYASIGLFGIEKAYKHIKHWNWALRGLVYMVVILAMECISGWILLWVTGYSIWYYDDGLLTVFTYTSLAIAPMWFIVGLLSENFYHIVDKLVRLKVKAVG